MKRVFTQIFPLWFPRQLPWTTLFLYLTSPFVQLLSFISSFYLLLLLNSYAGCAKLTNDLSVSVHYLLPHWNQGTSTKLGFCMFGGEKNVLGKVLTCFIILLSCLVMWRIFVSVTSWSGSSRRRWRCSTGGRWTSSSPTGGLVSRPVSSCASFVRAAVAAEL